MYSLIVKGLIVQLVNGITTIGLSLLTPAFFIAGTLGLHFLIPGLIIDTTLLTLYFLVMCTSYNGLIMLVLGFGRLERGEDIAHYFSIIIPAHNEEAVIGDTLTKALQMEYPSELYEIIVVNDGSTDATEQIVRNFQIEYPNVKLINIQPTNGGLGKGRALNIGFRDFLFTWRGLEIKPKSRWIIGVFDADGHPQTDILKKVSFEFKEPRVGGVQTLVRISNRRTSFLAKLQDIEFIAFSRVVQFSRTFFKGSVALGGNGQFVRATALDTVTSTHPEQCWDVKSLTEDLDMGIRLSMEKWEMRYVGSTAVEQEGVENFRSLIRQRTRWSWGTLQALTQYIFSFRLLRTEISLKKKVDTSIYLLNILVPFFVLLCWVLTGMGSVGLIRISNVFPFFFTIANAFSYIPFYFIGLWKERTEYPLWQIFPLTVIETIYTYHWIPCITSAMIKTIAQKPIWVKTPRYNHSYKGIASR